MKVIRPDLNAQHFPIHECKSTRIGDWIHFTCPKCDFKRKIHLYTGQIITEGGDFKTLHKGLFVPTGIQPEKMNAN